MAEVIVRWIEGAPEIAKEDVEQFVSDVMKAIGSDDNHLFVVGNMEPMNAVHVALEKRNLHNRHPAPVRFAFTYGKIKPDKPPRAGGAQKQER